MRNPTHTPSVIEEAFRRLPASVTTTPLGNRIFKSLQRTMESRNAPKRTFPKSR